MIVANAPARYAPCMNDCIFCKIAAGEVPAHVFYEDADTVAFLDAKPNHPGHSLVIPKKHARNVLDVDEDTWVSVMKTVRKIAPVIKEGVAADGLNIIMNNEPAGHQVVFHMHAHVIPRYAGDGFKLFPPGDFANEHQAQEVAETFRALLRA